MNETHIRVQTIIELMVERAEEEKNTKKQALGEFVNKKNWCPMVRRFKSMSDPNEIQTTTTAVAKNFIVDFNEQH